MIAFDATILSKNIINGFNRYTSEILKNFKIAPLIVYASINASGWDSAAQVRMVSPFLSQGNFQGNLSRLLWRQSILPASLRRNRIRLYYSPMPEGMMFPFCPQIVTVHDLIPLLYRDANPRLYHYYRKILPRVLCASEAIIVTSENTKKDLQRIFNRLDKPVHVVYQGYRKDAFFPRTPSDCADIKRKYGLTNFFMCIGESRSYKNTSALLRAFAASNREEADLAVIGDMAKLPKELLDLPRKLGIQRKVKFLGFVPDHELSGLYSAAMAFVFPSLYEGFGIPPLEAMACGCPVIVSNVSSLPEICGPAGYYVDPHDASSIVRALLDLAEDASLRARLKIMGLEQAKRFSYESAGSKLVKVIDSHAPPYASR